MSFWEFISGQAKELTGNSLLLRWCSNEIQDVIKLMCKEKPLDNNLNGLLGLIMFAGINEECFSSELIEKVMNAKSSDENKIK